MTKRCRVPEKVRATMAPLIHLELQSAVRDQKMAFEGALIAVQVSSIGFRIRQSLIGLCF